MIINDKGQKRTPKQIAQRIARVQLNMVNLDAEIENYSRLTVSERDKIYDQYWKLVERIDNKYIERKS